MEKERRVKALSIVALLIAVVGLTVAFAAMSRTLTINGTATMDTARWNIHFANITNNKVHAATVNSAQITGETTITYGVTLTKPGDKAEIEFDVVNSGDIDAYIGGLNVFTLNCENETGDRNIVCSNLEWSLKYKETGNTNIVAVNDTLKSGQTRHMIYEIGYKELAETLPEDDVTFNDLQITITYNQDMGNSASHDSSGGDISSDTDTYYNIKFNDLTSFDFDTLLNGEELKQMFTQDSNGKVGVMYVAGPKGEQGYLMYMVDINAEESAYQFYTLEEKNGTLEWYYYNGEEDPVKLNNSPIISNVKILTESELTDMGISLAVDTGMGKYAPLLTPNEINQIMNLTKVN